MANFFKDYTKKSVERFKVTKEDESLLKSKNEGSEHDPRKLQEVKDDET